ncbi:TVP38/TMEM64 family protein [Aerococcus urinae]|uniref:TVP38/TMEM64 family membrane protein n=1 Tax=Aerococcus urinae TaxID=1376 RepID=A0A7T2RR50_9LACT|nr:TVP38/TMEM64 family protein [Aerococcus urinae]MCY3032943.1 TVP38/TMEM64 family protein [Aerococcus urinae]MCY3038087.1 TVP38/TMEM64 family protein [Aerococcus urinae]MCY3044989.1 TVP38/TMEM64 family protein [Aerococcus urinae]MCY3046148.1 TVP38/TMEM64 family protein [Aerococcus urinae]MCY3048443.1 TVP38/TMEM64 family protein [Aerococcus urinae]
MSTPKDCHPKPVTPKPSCPKEDKSAQLSDDKKQENALRSDSNKGQNLARETRSLKRARLANQVFNLVGILGVILTIWLIYAAYQRGLFSSQENLEAFLRGFGGWAPWLFILIQIVQTVIPVIPGGLTCPAGAAIFGVWYGFLLNFIGIMIGSVIDFWLARRYGRHLVMALIGPKSYNKYIHYLNTKTFDRIFIFGMFFPVSPADALCLLAGLSNMTFKRFFLFLSLGKPFTLFIYTYGLLYLSSWIGQLLGL